jgi:hypothetical protein
MPNQDVVVGARVLLAMFTGETRARPQRRFHAADQASAQLSPDPPRASQNALNNDLRPMPLATQSLPYSIPKRNLDRGMARYGITRIRLNVQGTHVYAVEYRGIIPGRYVRWQVGRAIQIARVGMLDIVRTPGNRVITLPRDTNGNYDKGQKVFIELGPDGIEYLESVADGIERNNLRALPAF